MRFGLSDLDELPSLKEFEALAREALGSDEGFAPSEGGDESVLNGMSQLGVAEASVPAATSAASPAENATSGEAQKTPASAVEAGDVPPQQEGLANGHAHDLAAPAPEMTETRLERETEPQSAADHSHADTAETSAHKIATAGE